MKFRKVLKEPNFYILLAYLAVIPIYEYYRIYTKIDLSLPLIIQYVSGVGIGYNTYAIGKHAGLINFIKDLFVKYTEQRINENKSNAKHRENFDAKLEKQYLKDLDLEKRIVELESRLYD